MGVTATGLRHTPRWLAGDDVFAFAGKMLAVGALYFGAARLSLDYASLVGKTVTPVWPPTGIALVGLLVFGWRIWPGITLAAFLANVIDQPAHISAGIALGNTLAPLVSYALLRTIDFHPNMERMRDAIGLVFLGALGGMLVSATIGTTVLLAGNVIEGRAFLGTWSVWWTGDAMGVLVFAPFLLLLVKARWMRHVGWLRRLEYVVLAVYAGTVAYFVTRSELSLLYLVFPFLIWSALRFQAAGAAPTVMIVSLMAVSAAVDGVGPFADRTLLHKMISLQAFNGSVSLTAFLLAAQTSERMRARRAIEEMRRKQALELNDEIVQGLSVAKYALDLDDEETARRAVERTLGSARTIVSELLRGEGEALGPGDLVRERPADLSIRSQQEKLSEE